MLVKATNKVGYYQNSKILSIASAYQNTKFINIFYRLLEPFEKRCVFQPCGNNKERVFKRKKRRNSHYTSINSTFTTLLTCYN